MKILHIAAGELSGGAAKGSYLLHQAQCKIGVNSKLLISGGDSYGDESVIALTACSQHKRIELALSQRIGNLPLSLYRRRRPWIFNTGLAGIDFTRLPDYKSADLVHLHWINGLVAIPSLQKVKKPIVWTMRDMWPLTGGCHYSMECNRYQEGCGKCPQLQSRSYFDISRFTVSMKRRCLPAKLQPVGISFWLSNAASSSAVFANHSVRTISNNIDTRVFAPTDQGTARSLLSLPSANKIILIGAQKLTDFYKGFDLFLDAIRYLARDDIHVVTFGHAAKAAMASILIPQIHLGFLADSISLRLAYSAADLFVAPSRMEAFGKTLAESLACGTPAVCFNATGPRDIVDHKRTGYKAQPFDAADLARGIDWVLGLPPDHYQAMRSECRETALKRFDSRVIARQYLNLYQEILE
ncbi:glycosyltransferase family 4 protein [Cyanobium sp. FACHB-13342]|uniref:glycosyltransferase family 4 protein n=1 Tax=Cyanobium sp. FACHB-13342 TaxID=2692793 RepID=UPI00167FEDAE|nr:glycosyltransferase family 4 protein [Cyanobium sp. FACHB-13342]MBD2422489.1 glycosyltransferase family 4 protein [Cyanobium sp. FACHB-13342]